MPHSLAQQIVCEFQHIESSSPETDSATQAAVVPFHHPLAPRKPLEVADFKLTAASRIAPPPALPAITTADLKPFKVLDDGAQGSVSLVQYLPDGRLYALKAIPKCNVDRENAPLIFQEQAIHKELDGSRFFPRLRGSFEDDRNFYLLTVRGSRASCCGRG